MESQDVVIVGGGPAGLSAALAFGRARAQVLLVDGGTPRNARAREMHNFVSRDGIPPPEFRAAARAQLAAYPSLTFAEGLVTRIEPLAAPDQDGHAFAVHIAERRVLARKVLLATGLRDVLPPLPGLEEHWGHAAFQCPYCHGWELRDRPWGVLVTSEAMAQFASFLRGWSDEVTALTDGAELTEETLAALRLDVTVETGRVRRLVGAPELEAVELEDGRRIPVGAFVLRPRQTPIELVGELGLALDDSGYVKVDPMTKESSLRGLFVAGDATTMAQAAIFAAADGTAAATRINHALVLERNARRRARS